MPQVKGTLTRVSKWLIEGSTYRRLWLVFGIAFLLRLIIFGIIVMMPKQSLQIDSQSYLRPAQNMLTHGVFSQDTTPPYTPDALRTPGYPAFLALFMLLFGTEPYIGIVAAQVVIGALTSIGLLLLGQKLFNSSTGLLVGFLHAIAPMQVSMVGWILTETLFTALLVSGLLLLVTGFQKSKWWMFGLSGLIFGLAALTRPIGLWMLVPLVLALLLHDLPRPRWQPALLFVVGYALVAGLWMGRNYIHFGRTSLSSAMDFHLYYYAVPDFTAERQGISLDEARQSMDARLAEYPDTGDRWPLAREGTMARQIIMEHPVEFVWSNGIKSLKGLVRPGFSFALFTLSDENSTARDPVSVFASGDPLDTIRALFLENGWILALHIYMLVFTWGLLGLSLVGLVALIVRHRWSLVMILGLLPALMLYPPGVSANARYRSSVEPLLMLLFIVGVSWLRNHFRRTLVTGQSVEP